MSQTKRLPVIWLISVLLIAGCYRPGPGAKVWQDSDPARPSVETSATEDRVQPPTRIPSLPLQAPTPDVPAILPTLRSDMVYHTVRAGESLSAIAQRYLVTVERLIQENEIPNPNQVEVGQIILVPPPVFEGVAPAFKIIPDSELVNSPSNMTFDLIAFIESYGGYLATYREEVDQAEWTGAEIVARIALEYSVNPRLLLTVLEYQSGWVTTAQPAEETLKFPLRVYDAWREGLYQQLAFAADLLNGGYYLWKVDAIGAWVLRDNAVIEVEPTINAGTAGVLNLMRHLGGKPEWESAVLENGIFTVYQQFFGYPFDFAYEPMIPEGLKQPEMQLPFEAGEEWSFTSGPHGGWGSGSAWAALDFAPPGDALGCFPSDSWVVAAAPGQIVYSDHGAVIQDLDGDGHWQTGWSVLYMHMDTWERVQNGLDLEAGDRVGHPSCEGGFSTGTHVHIARRYNGEWIAADGPIPFVMDGWVSEGYGVEYDGYLVNGNLTVEAWNGRSPLNAIQR